MIGTELGEERERTPQITDPRETRAKLAGLKPKTKYRIDIYATTSKGQGEKMYIEVQTNDKSEQRKAMHAFYTLSEKCLMCAQFCINFSIAF